ncbi:MAG: outer membrane protein assembly factor BamD [bacterium]
MGLEKIRKKAFLPLCLACWISGFMLFSACGKSVRRAEIAGPQESFRKALHLYQRERYFKAQEILKDIVLNYSGSAIIDSVKLYLGLTYFQMRDYLTAADEFERIRQVYPQSPIAGEAQFHLALSYFRLAPVFALDQQYTAKALAEFQRLIDDFENHPLKLDAQKHIEQCRDKLGHKEYAAAVLYYKMGEYASSVLYTDVVLEDYYDTRWAPAAQFLKAKCFLSLKNQPRATEELEKFLTKYPGRREEMEVRTLLTGLRNRGQ